MDGGLSGLDWPAALASLPAGLDMERVKRLLAVAEAAFVAAWWDYAQQQRQQLPKKT
jgi:hypothetical protein